jgi:AcrR family transcriptional regulator
MAKPDNRNMTEQAFLDAAERLLVEVGYANITTRRLAEEAGANLGLVHYYFGSMEQLFVRVLERFTDRLRTATRMYAEQTVHRKWRAAMRYLDEDRRAATRRSGWSCAA